MWMCSIGAIWNRPLFLTGRTSLLSCTSWSLWFGVESSLESPSLLLPLQFSTPSRGCDRVNEEGMLRCDLSSTPVNCCPWEKGKSGRAKAFVTKFFLIKADHRSQGSAYVRQQRSTWLLNTRKGFAIFFFNHLGHLEWIRQSGEYTCGSFAGFAIPSNSGRVVATAICRACGLRCNAIVLSLDLPWLSLSLCVSLILLWKQE